jgi:hypothetical protein
VYVAWFPYQWLGKESDPRLKKEVEESQQTDMHRPPYNAIVFVKSTPNVEQAKKHTTQECNQCGVA